MGFQDEMAEYIEDADEYLTEIEEDIRSFFAELDIVEQENMLLKDIDADARTYEWAPRTETSSAQKEARQKYEQWYNAVEPLVYQYLPRRYDEFEESRSKIIRYLSLKSRFWESPPEDPIQRAVEIVELLHGQQSIVKSTLSRVAAERFNARKGDCSKTI